MKTGQFLVITAALIANVAAVCWLVFEVQRYGEIASINTDAIAKYTFEVARPIVRAEDQRKAREASSGRQ